MNSPSNPSPSPYPNPDFFDFDENLGLDLELSNLLLMLDEEIINRTSSSSSTWSITSSEKIVVDGTSPPASVVTSSMNRELIKGKDGSTKRKKPEGAPIHVFRTKSTIETLDDGYKWRKYGKKLIKGSPFPRHYHKCSSPDCGVKKQIERDTGDPEYVLTKYEGKHNHESPSVVYYDLDDINFSPNVLSFQSTSNLSRSAP